MPLFAQAAERYKVADLPLDRCELQEVIARMSFESIQNIAVIAEQSMLILDQIGQINSKATIPNKPIGDQLSPEDIAKFAELGQRQKTLTLAQLIESRRQRDLIVIEKMTMLADQNYRWKTEPKEDTQDYIVYSFLALLQLSVVYLDDPIFAPTSPICNLDHALYSHEEIAITKYNEGNEKLNISMKEINEINAKYGTEKIDRSLLSKSDLKNVNEITNNVFKPMQRHANFIKDIENIKLMGHASEIMYESTKQDIAFGGGDVEAIGQTIKRKTEKNEFDENTIIALGIWSLINEKIPSDVVQQWSDLKNSQK